MIDRLRMLVHIERIVVDPLSPAPDVFSRRRKDSKFGMMSFRPKGEISLRPIGFIRD